MKINQSLFGIEPIHVFIAEIKGENRLMVLYKEQFYNTPGFKKYLAKRKEQMEMVNLPLVIDFKGGIYNNFVYLHYPEIFSKSHYKPFYTIFSAVNDDKKKKMLSGLLDFVHEMHRENVVIGNLSPELFLIDNNGLPFHYGLFLGYENKAILKKLLEFNNGLDIFLSPEQLKDEQATQKSDIFSLALSIIYLYTGKKYDKNDILSNNLPIPDELKDYKNLLENMLSENPEDRVDIEVVYQGFNTKFLPVHFTYYDKNKIADTMCAKCNRPILKADAQKIGDNYFCQECINAMSGKKKKEEKKEEVHYCKYHKKRVATHQCEKCGAYICDDCTEEINGKIYCPECAIIVKKELEREKIKRLREESQKAKVEEQSENYASFSTDNEFPYQEYAEKTNTEFENNDFNFVQQEGFEEEETVKTMPEYNASNLDEASIKKDNKSKSHLLFIIGGVLIVLITLLIILFGKAGGENKEIRKYKKLVEKTEDTNMKLFYISKVSDDYLKFTKDKKQGYENAINYLRSFLNSNMSNLDKINIYKKIIEIQARLNRYKDILKTFKEMEEKYKGDQLLYPQVLFEKARFYKQHRNKRKAKAIYLYIKKHYPRSPYARKAYEELKRL